MSESTVTSCRELPAKAVLEALYGVTIEYNDVVEAPEPVCVYQNLCGLDGCRFPRYFRAQRPAGLVSHVLLELGYPRDLLKALDTEYEVGEVLHPGVKIGRSRNPALVRIDKPGRALLSFLQDRQKLGRSWGDLAVEAVRPRRMIPYLDARRRPWLY
jgi:hypothetical protein